MRVLRGLGLALLSAAALAGLFTIYLSFRQFQTARRLEREWQTTQVAQLTDLGSTRSLEIMPLVDELTSDEVFQSEHGVAYLIKTNTATVLFDVGQNASATDPSPLEANMAHLGVSLGDIDTLVISHNHPDHTGGQGWWRSGSFSLGSEQAKLTGKTVYVPTPLSYPSVTPIVATQPQKIVEGVATLGTISFAETWPMSLFAARNVEQALAINVEGQGVVIISGCGHQTLARLLERARDLLKEPIIGLVGGLHYGTAMAEALEPDLHRLQDLPLQLLALSPHDSEAAPRLAFKEAFPNQYQAIRVGEPVRLTTTATLSPDSTH